MKCYIRFFFFCISMSVNHTNAQLVSDTCTRTARATHFLIIAEYGAMETSSFLEPLTHKVLSGPAETRGVIVGPLECLDPYTAQFERTDMEERRNQLRQVGYTQFETNGSCCLPRLLQPSRENDIAYARYPTARYFLCHQCTLEETLADPQASSRPSACGSFDQVPPGFNSLIAFETHMIVKHCKWWTTPLHHLASPAHPIISAAEARRLLRNGDNINVCASALAPTPLAFAQQLEAAGLASEGSAAHLVLQAASPWSPSNHMLFPPWARERAWFVLLVGNLLSRGGRDALVEPWLSVVMPHVITRDRV